jgi:hypothetical protein
VRIVGVGLAVALPCQCDGCNSVRELKTSLSWAEVMVQCRFSCFLGDGPVREQAGVESRPFAIVGFERKVNSSS